MRKIVSVLICLVMIMQCLSIMSFAETDISNVYVDSNGNIIEYYIDDEGYEYIYLDGKKTYVLLPLEKYRITDENIIAEELVRMQRIEDCNEQLDKGVSRGTVVIKTIFNSTVNFGDSVYRIGYHTWSDGASHIRLKTSDHKPALSNHNLNIIFYWYLEDSNQLYGTTYMDQNCSITKGFSLGSTGIEKVDVGITPVGSMTSCNFSVTLTAG